MQEDNPVDIQEIILRLERLIEYFERKNKKFFFNSEFFVATLRLFSH